MVLRPLARARAPVRRAGGAQAQLEGSFDAPPVQAQLDPHFALKYQLDQRDVEVDGETAIAGPLNGYLTSEMPQPGRPRATRGLILLPDASGWQHPPTRRLADRLAVFCAALVLIPDVLRGGAPWPAAAPW